MARTSGRSRGCLTCRLKRIKCDETEPQCSQCVRRRLKCPGPIKGIFVFESDPGAPPKSRRAAEDILISKAEIHGGKTYYDVTSSFFNRQYAATGVAKKLLNHFQTKVVSRLTWLDSSEHPWRTFILPLMQKSECLRMSILSLAAAHSLHATAYSSSDVRPFLIHVHHGLRHESLQSLNRAISRVLATPATPTFQCLAKVLATALVLCFEGLLTPKSHDWENHLQACRKIIDGYRLNVWNALPDHPVAKFLFKEVEDFEMYSSFSCFTRSSPSVIAPDDRCWKYTKVVGEITLAERQLHGLPGVSIGLLRQELAILQAKVKEAYNQLTVTALQIPPADRELFDSVLRAHYYALLVYTEQIMFAQTQSWPSLRLNELVATLFNEVRILTDGPIHAFSHDIFFPIFIAGTECWRNPIRQRFVETIFRRLLSATGVWCNETALHFLNGLWSHPDYRGQGKWIAYARDNEWESPLIVF